MIQNTISNRLAAMAGAYVSEKVIEEIQAEPYKDKAGNYVGKCTPTIKIVLGGLILVSYLLSFTLPFLGDIFEPEERKLVWGICGLLFVEATLLTLLLKKRLFYQYILTKDELVIKKIFGIKKIPYSELKTAGNTFPPMLYGLAMVYVSKSEVIKLEYTYLMGGVKFNLYFAELIGHSLDDNMTQEVIQRVHRSSARANKEEKRELQKRKKYVQNIKG